MANMIRVCPYRVVNMTLVMATRAPKATSAAAQLMPAPSSRAKASGASLSWSSLAGRIPTVVTDTSTYTMVAISREPQMAMGRSRLGFLASSLPVETASKPMKAKKMIAQLHDHHDGVGPGRLAGALHRQGGDGGDDQHRGQVEGPAFLRGGGQRVGDPDAEAGVQELVEVAAPADRDRGHGDAVLEDQVPADDPGHDLAGGGVGVGVGAARDRDRGGQLGVRQDREQAGQGGEDERDGDRRAGVGERNSPWRPPSASVSGRSSAWPPWPCRRRRPR
jgi:hypothetical protein